MCIFSPLIKGYPPPLASLSLNVLESKLAYVSQTKPAISIVKYEYDVM